MRTRQSFGFFVGESVDGKRAKTSFLFRHHPDIFWDIIDFLKSSPIKKWFSLQQIFFHYCNDMHEIPKITEITPRSNPNKLGKHKCFVYRLGEAKYSECNPEKRKPFEYRFGDKEFLKEKFLKLREECNNENMFSQKLLTYENLDLVDYIFEETTFLNSQPNCRIRNRIWAMKHDVKSIPKCRMCGADATFSKVGCFGHFKSLCDREECDVMYRLKNGAWANCHRHHSLYLHGKEYTLQGYDAYGVKHLLSMGYDEDDLVIRGIWDEIGGPIRYTFEGVTRRYLPDIYIKSEHKMIEIKSTYTLDKCGTLKRHENPVFSKFDAVKSMGINMEIWVMDGPNLLFKIKD